MRRITLAVALVSWAVFTAAAAEVKLPEEIALPRGSDSPGQVSFFHETHVDLERPACTTCHPRLFPILRETKRPVIVHERFDKGEACAACHNGTKAFAIDDDCANCHKS